MEKRKGSAGGGKTKRALEAQRQFPDAGVKKKKRKVEEAERPNGEAKPEKGEEKAAAPLPPTQQAPGMPPRLLLLLLPSSCVSRRITLACTFLGVALARAPW